jgi:hypothetical protein
MAPLEASASDEGLGVTTFEGSAGERRLILLNCSAVPSSAHATWPGKPFRDLETVSPGQANAVASLGPGPDGRIRRSAGRTWRHCDSH